MYGFHTRGCVPSLGPRLPQAATSTLSGLETLEIADCGVAHAADAEQGHSTAFQHGS